MSTIEKIISLSQLKKYKLISKLTDESKLDEKALLDDAIACIIENATELNVDNLDRAMDRFLHGDEPYPCFNAVCPQYRADATRPNYCAQGADCFNCSFQLIDEPPSPLDYEDEMPTHQEALDILELNGLLAGPMHEQIEMATAYRRSKPTTLTDREEYEVKLPMHTIKTCVENAIIDIAQNEYNTEVEQLVLNDWSARIGIATTMEIEKACGVYPNIKLF
jgi:hypothetical protein